MELQFGELDLERLAADVFSQATVEGELPLPEGRQGAAVLDAAGTVRVTEASAAEGSVQVSGRLRVELLCTDGDTVFAAAASTGFRHSFPVREAAPNLRAEACAQIESMRVEGGDAPRLFAVLRIRCRLIADAPIRVPVGASGAEAPEWRKEKLTSVRRVLLGQENVPIREELHIPGAAQVIRAGGTIEVRDVRLGGDTALVEGTLFVDALCADETGQLMQQTLQVPLSLEMEAAEKGHGKESCSAAAEVGSLTLSPEEGESGLFVAEAQAALTLTAAEEASFEVPLAAYVPGMPLDAAGEDAAFLLRGAPILQRFRAAETLQVPEGMPPCARVAACYARPILTAAVAEEGQLRAEGLLFTRVIAETENNMRFTFTEDIPFRVECAAPLFAEDAWAEVRLLSASAAGAGESIAFSYTLQLRAEPCAVRETKVVTGFRESEREMPGKGIVLYFADAGETLFDVGCCFRVAQSRIRDMNPDAGEVLREGERLTLLL